MAPVTKDAADVPRNTSNSSGSSHSTRSRNKDGDCSGRRGNSSSSSRSNSNRSSTRNSSSSSTWNSSSSSGRAKEAKKGQSDSSDVLTPILDAQSKTLADRQGISPEGEKPPKKKQKFDSGSSSSSHPKEGDSSLNLSVELLGPINNLNKSLNSNFGGV